MKRALSCISLAAVFLSAAAADAYRCCVYGRTENFGDEGAFARRQRALPTGRAGSAFTSHILLMS